MNIIIEDTKESLGLAAAEKGTELIKKTIREKGRAAIIVATGASQFEMLSALVNSDIDWPKVAAFHLDEYIGIHSDHPASFRNYLKTRFVDKVNLRSFHYIEAEEDPQKECRRLNKIISDFEIDVAFVGIGENAHLAFNDPPADFTTEEPYIVVNLDKDCRLQQLNEGWFKSLYEVPRQAISMSINQILRSRNIICSVPDERKAKAVHHAVKGEITPDVPSSILQKHDSCWIYLDKDSSRLLETY